MHRSLISCLNESGIILTPSRRLSARLAQEYSLLQKGQAWPSPAIMTLEDWLGRQWQQYEIQGQINQVLITPMQSIIKLESCIKASEAGKGLYKVHETAKIVFEAWYLLNHYLIAKNSIEAINHETQVFLEWITRYAQWLKQNHFVDKALWLATLTPLIAKEKAIPLVLYGFEELSPALQHLFNILIENDWSITEEHDFGVKPQTVYQKSYIDFEQECQAAANWAQAKAQQGLQVACICPTLTDNRDKIEAIFKNTFSPLDNCIAHARVIPEFNISAAVPLSKNPIIAIALKILSMGLPFFQMSDYAQLLNSPFCHHYEAEKFNRAQHGEKIRTLKLLTWDLQSALNFVQHSGAEISHWQQALEKVNHLLQATPVMTSLHTFKTLFEKILLALGWPGDRQLTSVEYQIIMRWQTLLEEFCQYAIILEDVNYTNAWSLLVKLAANTAFQPENKNAQVQILGLLESIGQSFDAAWIMGLDNTAWPPFVKPNPFIPITLQLQYDFPHACQEREMKYATLITQRLLQCAHEIIFSYSHGNEYEIELSPLIKEAWIKLPDDFTETKRIENEFNVEVEHFVDEQAPPLNLDEQISGKVRLLETQALCPFKAFAEMRLNIQVDQEIPIWLTAKMTGMLLHAIVQDLWTTLKDQKKLLSLQPEELNTLVQQVVDKNVATYVYWDVPQLYVTAEKQRLYTLIQNYLTLEKTRTPFQVTFLEKNDEYTLQQMRFKLRPDRIDQDEKGNTIIIDYKTGQFNLSDVWSERLIAPQLPLYYFATPSFPKAIMVINLTEGTFEGMSEVDIGIEGIKTLENMNKCPYTRFEDLTSYWQTQLNVLVSEFQSGVATVTPLQGEQTCRHCHLGPLCRVKERS